MSEVNVKPESDEVLPGLKVIKNSKNALTVCFLHYSAWPEKWTAERLEEERKLYVNTPGKWDREMELSFTTPTGKSVFPNFDRKVHIRKLQYVKGRTVYRSWDFGFQRPACVFAQIDDRDRFCILRAEMGHRETLFDFAPRILRICDRAFPMAKFEDFCDPSGNQTSDKSDKTSIQILNTYAVYPGSRFTHVEDGLNLIRRKLQTRDDNEPGMLVDENCNELIDAFIGGYAYNEATSPEPIKDGYYEHLMDAVRYMVVHLFSVFDEVLHLPHIVQYVPANPLTGY